MIIASHDTFPDLGCEAIIFLDDESGECFQIQRDLLGTVETPRPRYSITTGVGAPVDEGILSWRRDDDEFEFALIPRAARLFGGASSLAFRVVAAEETTVADIAAHLDRLVG
ncbi:hypothetical protein [Williamsia sterculiae]|uniref:Uncharacterized protein n=1 Tax=Williamsia sterculiae TaxID=1344003 RepID=A0A1N7F6E1_9NOCA|nr:hypothetical protein [Williamsia sterculiae]SIR95869.1 hypothetical protein SAMN05445060_1858 [Williamsia sterculiae]